MNASTVTMEELELERAELLPNVSALNGSFDNILSLGSGNIR
jgi:hypothetical protein